MASREIFLGIVLNPKTLEPCAAYFLEDQDVQFYRADLRDVEGVGYFDLEDPVGGDYSESSYSGYCRVHTPRGVKTQGKGYGTVLYTSLCLAAHVQYEGGFEIEAKVMGDGISSNHKRSKSAQKWWEQAKAQGLAEEVELDTTREEEIEEDVEGEFSSRDLSRYTSSHQGTLRSKLFELITEAVESTSDHGYVGLESFHVSWEGKTTRLNEITGSADVYKYENAAQFVPFWLALDTSRAGEDHGWVAHPERAVSEVSEFNADVFSIMDIRNADPGLVAYLEEVAKANDAMHAWRAVQLYAAIGKRVDEHDEDRADAYDDVHPLRKNPSPIMKSLSKADRAVIAKRAKVIEQLGLERFANLPDIDDEEG